MREGAGAVVTDRVHLSEPERVVFKRPPLVLTVFQLRFSDIPEIADQSYIEPFRNAIRERYPSFAPVQQLGFQFDFSANEPRRIETVQWRFSEESENWTVVLARDFLTLETRRYEHFPEFLSHLLFLLNSLVEHIRPQFGTRLGLRYINEIRLALGSLSTIVRPELLGILSIAEFEKYAAQSTQEVLLRYSEEQSIQVRHGLFPAGSTVQPPTGEPSSTGPFYLLDFDAFRTFSAPTWLRMETDTICEYVHRYHDDIEKLFRWSLTEEFTKSLGERDLD
jgi:uncharacterized protein (TIGR04255 family)